MLDQMRRQSLRQGSPGRKRYTATLGGAKVLGLSDRLEILTPGKDADFVVVGLAR
jgi:cytosine/adenosine deaminase-related metal-dependent hydrolase